MTAEYLVLRDKDFTLGSDEERTFEFNIPADTDKARSHKNAILVYMIKSHRAMSEMRYEIDVNHRKQVFNRVGNDEKLGFWELLDGSKIKRGQNTIQFRVESGPSKVTFSDVVLWFHKKSS